MNASRVLHRSLHRAPAVAVRGQGVCLYDQNDHGWLRQ